MRDNNFFKWNDEEFRARFRYEVTNEEKVLITLRYLATGSTLQAVGDFTGIDKSTASRIIHKSLQSDNQDTQQFTEASLENQRTLKNTEIRPVERGNGDISLPEKMVAKKNYLAAYRDGIHKFV
ncbi:hypothetical protein JTB14_028488 [Gonioctena quinquepunctata]|nr:hypothetical protein JTB14_028488 [Gonioctena quinquepunctata]